MYALFGPAHEALPRDCRNHPGWRLFLTVATAASATLHPSAAVAAARAAAPSARRLAVVVAPTAAVTVRPVAAAPSRPAAAVLPGAAGRAMARCAPQALAVGRFLHHARVRAGRPCRSSPWSRWGLAGSPARDRAISRRHSLHGRSGRCFQDRSSGCGRGFRRDAVVGSRTACHSRAHRRCRTMVRRSVPGCRKGIRCFVDWLSRRRP